MGGCASKEAVEIQNQNENTKHDIKNNTGTGNKVKSKSRPQSSPNKKGDASIATRATEDDQDSNESSKSDGNSAKNKPRLDGSLHRRMDGSTRQRMDGSMHSVRSTNSMNGGLAKVRSAVGLDTMIESRKEEGGLTSNIVHMEVPFGKPIEEVYEGVHDGPILGSGISGVVRKCTHMKTGVTYAVKCLDLGLIGTDQALEQLREEIFIMCQLDHPNIVRLEEVYESLNEIYLVMELCTGGELFDRLDEQPDYHYTEQDCARLVKQMLNAVRYLHSKGIVHRDLKLENFLFQSIESDSDLKMIDFGLSKHFETGEIHNEAVGTPYTVAPEVILGKYDERCDVWAIGVITYLLLSGDPPFGGCGGPETLMQVRSNILSGRFEFEPAYIWEAVSEQAKDFIKSLLVIEPIDRPTARGAQHSRWLEEWAVKESKPGNNILNPNVVKSLVNFKEYGDMRKLLCEVLSFTLLPDQIRDLRKEFEKLDKDGSGEISLEALKKVLMANAGAGSLGGLKEEEVEDIFDAMRVRKTETTIHWHEFIAAGLSQCKVDDRNLRLAFDRLDSGHKGFITIDDIVDLMGSDGIESEERIRRTYVDGLKDIKCTSSKIVYEDFVMLMKGQTMDGEVAAVPLKEKKLPTLLESMRENSSTTLEPICETGLNIDETFSDDNIESIMPAKPKVKPVFGRQRSQSEGVLELADSFDDSIRSSQTRPSAGQGFALALPEHDHNDKKFDDMLKDETKSSLAVNRNLYRAHRQMRLAVLEASKLFEEQQMKHVFKEEVKKSSARVGAGLVMKHGQSKKLSTDEVRKILRQRQEEQQTLVEKASKKGGRARRKKTVSDMTAMLASPAPEPRMGVGLKSELSGTLSNNFASTASSCPTSPAIHGDILHSSPGTLPPLPSMNIDADTPVGLDLEPTGLTNGLLSLTKESEKSVNASPSWPPPPL